MAQLITILILVFAGWWLYRRFISDARKLAEKSRRAEKERQTGAIGTLVKDPTTGEYRLKREEE
jgi:membrane protein implicated in regulation of membrane protease activity